MKTLLFLTTLFLVLNCTAQSDSNFFKAKAMIAGVNHGSIKKTALLKATNLLTDSTGIVIKCFRITFVNKGKALKDLIEITNSTDDQITTEMKAAIANCSSGDKIFIEFIKGVDSHSTVHSIAPIDLQIE